MYAIWRNLYITVSFGFLLAGCSTAGHISNWDADTRNNEDASLGAKNITISSAPDRKRPTLDPSRAHYNGALQMSREAADLIVRMTHVPWASVAVTNNHVYVAVDPKGHIFMTQSDQKQMHTFSHDPASGAGLFGSGAGTGLDWSSAEPLPKETSEAIFRLMRHSFPGGNVYISTNPNFVSRMKFYESRQEQSKGMGDYLNEFNTMVQYTFPMYSNGTNQMLTK